MTSTPDTDGHQQHEHGHEHEQQPGHRHGHEHEQQPGFGQQHGVGQQHGHESQHAHAHAHEHGNGRGHAEHGGSEGMTDLLDLDAEVLYDYWTAALDWVQSEAAGAPRNRLLDLGAGTGTGAIGLAGRFPGAAVIAVDIEDDSLGRLRDRVRDLGLDGRVSTVTADLDAGWPDLGPLDLTWASMSLHHMADPGAVLRDVLAASNDGGLIAVAEFPEPLRFLPVDLGTGKPGFEERVTADLNRAHAEQLPTIGSAWAPRLSDAGWQVVAERTFTIDLNPPAHPLATQYARAWFTRLSHGLADRLDGPDQATLTALLDDEGPHSLLRRTDLHIRGSRIVTLGRRG
jgi:ubiquinone/menaquinone biosynthesis C-methylase UbiE